MAGGGGCLNQGLRDFGDFWDGRAGQGAVQAVRRADGSSGGEGRV